jgi:hypothetical protein
MSVPFYDCIDVESTPDGGLDIERIYCFDWDAFSCEDLDRLRSIFTSLPQSKKHDADDCHWWHADHDDVEGGYLTAGVEPPGLQVFGTLPVEEWWAWDREFQRRAVVYPSGLPNRVSPI